jgi:hypothetical protein
MKEAMHAPPPHATLQMLIFTPPLAIDDYFG